MKINKFEYSRAVIEPFLPSLEQPVQFACLYGDAAAREVGYTPLGLSANAGFEVALMEFGFGGSLS